MRFCIRLTFHLVFALVGLATLLGGFVVANGAATLPEQTLWVVCGLVGGCGFCYHTAALIDAEDDTEEVAE